MELEEIKAIWSEMSDQLEHQKKLTNQIILEMTQERYTNKFRTITLYESLGAVVCFIAALFVLFNFGKLDTWYLQLCGIITLAFVLLMPILVLRALYKVKHLNITEGNYTDTIVAYSKAKNRLMMFQQLGIYGSFILMFTSLAVFSKIASDEDIFTVQLDWGVYAFLGVVAVFMIFFARWGYGCYKRLTKSAENIIQELE